VDRLSSFFDVIHQDPVLSQVKLIAEPWDVGPGGYQVGNFPTLWTEWNGKYRDSVRDFWRSETPASEFARRFTGSGDLYAGDGRRPVASINLVTAHDGFTLRDLVSYNHKHNEANLENNADGADDNRSWNCGVEGETDDPEVNALRARQQRNFLVTLLLSQGVPMLLGGDELGRTQRGNNNAWCQDNELSWYDWESADWDLHGFTRNLIRLRHDEPVFRRRDFLVGDASRSGVPDVAWYRPDGEEMTEADWEQDDARCLSVFLNGDEIPTHTRVGERLRGGSFLVLLNGHHEPCEFTIPPPEIGERWTHELSTAGEVTPEAVGPGEKVALEGRSVVLLRRG
jgi:glycogen operon protein